MRVEGFIMIWTGGGVGAMHEGEGRGTMREEGCLIRQSQVKSGDPMEVVQAKPCSPLNFFVLS